MRLFILALLLILRPTTMHTAVYQDCGGFQNYGERLEFYRLLKKHGLDKTVAVIRLNPDGKGWHFINDKGQRCPFK